MKATEGIRWTVQTASVEFGPHRETLSKRPKQLGVVPSDDGMFSTKQILSAIVRPVDREKLRKITAEADLLEMERGQAEGALIPASAVYACLENVVLTVREIILASELPEVTKAKVLTELTALENHDFSKPEPAEADAQGV